MNREKTICIIEDDINYLMLTHKMIEFTALFKEILTFRNGKQAYDGLLAWKERNGRFPDFILLDINMPIWDAWDFLEEFSKQADDWKGVIYIITSSIDKVDESRSQEFPLVKGFLKKPVGFDKIIELFQLG